MRNRLIKIPTTSKTYNDEVPKRVPKKLHINVPKSGYFLLILFQYF